MNAETSFRVTENDSGIRPAGQPDECFYCRSRVGDFHKCDCVIPQREVTYSVWLVDGDIRIGTYKTTEPAHWSDEDGEFHKNESSWCKGNIGDDAYIGDPLPIAPDGCICGLIRLECEERGQDAFMPQEASNEN